MSWTYLAPIVIVSFAVLIIVLERLYPYDKGQPLLREGLITDLVWYGLAQSYVLGLIITALVAWIDHHTGASTYGLISNWPLWAQVAFLIVLHDFYIYWFHRTQHRNKYLWRLHEAHHSAKQVDWIAGARSHALEILINQTVEVGAMVLLGASPEVVLIKMAISVSWGIWIHCNVDVHSGPLQYVINGPEMHRWHHAIDYPNEGSNYATKFAFWDYLFGTVYRPPRKPAGYGLAEPFPKGYVRQTLYAFRRFEPDAQAPDRPAAAA